MIDYQSETIWVWIVPKLLLRPLSPSLRYFYSDPKNPAVKRIMAIKVIYHG